MQLTNEFDVRKACDPATAGTSAVNGDTIDTQGASGGCFLAHMGAITGGAVTSLKVQEGDASDASDMADISGASITIPDDGDNKVFAVEVPRFKKRYARMVLVRGSQNSVLNSGLVALTDGRKKPAPAHSSFGGTTQVVR